MTLEDFEAICQAHPYQRKGMFYSEVFIFLQICRAHGVDVVIESGVKFGMSTRLLAAAFTGAVISIEKNPVMTIPGVEMLRGDSRQLLPVMIRGRFADHRVGVMIDGPKGRTALHLKDACLAAGAKIVAVHDQQYGQGESQHSHAKNYRSITLRLNRFVSDEYRKKYPYGSGLAIWER